MNFLTLAKFEVSRSLEDKVTTFSETGFKFAAIDFPIPFELAKIILFLI